MLASSCPLKLKNLRWSTWLKTFWFEIWLLKKFIFINCCFVENKTSSLTSFLTSFNSTSLWVMPFFISTRWNPKNSFISGLLPHFPPIFLTASRAGSNSFSARSRPFLESTILIVLSITSSQSHFPRLKPSSIDFELRWIASDLYFLSHFLQICFSGSKNQLISFICSPFRFL